MRKCIIVDDEPLARELLHGYIEQIPELELSGSYASAVEAFSALHQVQVDLMFLDIAMPGINGLSFVKSLKSPPGIVFVTAYTEHAAQAFDLDVTDYLVKPVTFERFLKAVQKTGTRAHDVASASISQERDHLFLKVDRRLVKIPAEQRLLGPAECDRPSSEGVMRVLEGATQCIDRHRGGVRLPVARIQLVHRPVPECHAAFARHAIGIEHDLVDHRDAAVVETPRGQEHEVDDRGCPEKDAARAKQAAAPAGLAHAATYENDRGGDRSNPQRVENGERKASLRLPQDEFGPP